jgi:hypothetical protein
MRKQPRVSRPQPSFRPLHTLDRMQAAVLAAMRRRSARERRALKASTSNGNGRSER